MRRVLPLLALCGAIALTACGSSWRRCAYEGFGRDGWQQPDRVIEVLKLPEDARVADLGAGGGYFTRGGGGSL
ncbi:MAG: hypothetical protein JRG92_20640 [Deltaproteobacteria bacterium]|nr:hypothetical protein [Deltaproteobacteria bacterium]MBW2695945.1 hypothetical protein [Deltaproteobacteria bacterium]